MLAWVGYNEAEFIQPLEDKLGVEINVRTYSSGDQMYSLFQQAPPGTYDIVVVDAEYGRRLHQEGRLTPLERNLWYTEGLFGAFKGGQPVRAQDEVYAAVVRWGALGLVYNDERVPDDIVQSYRGLWSSDVRDKVGIYDWYLPNMGVLSVYLEFENPFSLRQAQLQILADTLKSLRNQVSAIHGGTGEVIREFRNGNVWISPGIGEWAAAVLAEDGLPIEWTIPKEGGVIWVEALAIPTQSQSKGLARELIETIRQPDHLARLAWRDAYHSQIPVRSAYTKLDSTQRDLLHASRLSHLDSLLNEMVFRRLPHGETNEADWLNVWSSFKSR